jgi:hypothetical protein
MVSQGGITHLGSYIASYDDVIGDQDEDDDTFMHNPLNVYNLIRHVAVAWPIVEQVFEVNNFNINRTTCTMLIYVYVYIYIYIYIYSF